MGFLFGFLCGVLFIPLSLALGVYWFFTYSESYAEKRQEQMEQEIQKEKCEQLDLDDMPAALYASYLGQRNGNGLAGYVPDHLDPQYQFAGWISVKRIPEVDHRIIEPSLKKETKKHSKTTNGHNGPRKSSQPGDGEERPVGSGVAGSFGAGAASLDPRFTYLDTQNPHLSLPPCLQARFKDSKYAVIKGSTMFIYENDYLEECLGVITIPNYRISVPGQQKDSHIFAKRHPIWLQYHGSNHARRSTAGSDGSMSSSKDYYLSMVSCVDKEDLYFTLLRCAKLKPNNGRSFIREIPKRDTTLFEKSAMNTLIRTIHSNEHQFQAAWLNALMGRMFLGVYKTPQLKEMVLQKLVEKLTRVRLPNFLNDMRMKSVHLGDGVPLITRPKLLTLKPNGDMIMDMNLLYQGGFSAEVEAEAVVTVTKKIQPIKVSLVLMMALLRLEGRVQVWIKPPPCNRIWYGFYHKPQVEMKIEPVVSDKHIKSNLIIKAIENKMLEAIAETMVLPNMDDIPFSDSDGVGGIFGEEIPPGGEATSSPTPGKQAQAQASPRRSHSPGRASTINVLESPGAPRSAIDLGSDARNRAETLSANGVYQNMSGSRSHVSLGDELMQTNYTYDSKHRLMNPLDEDPMRSLRSGDPFTESPDEIFGAGHHGELGGDFMPHRSETLPANSSSSVGSKLFHRKGANPAAHNRRASQDPASYTSGASLPKVSSSSQFSGDMRTEEWSTYGMSEYEPAAPEGKSGKNKEKANKKVDKKQDKEGHPSNLEVDHISIDSKDSGDTGSTKAGPGSIYGLSGTTEGSVYSASAKSDKFSLTKMFQGFRKKHTKGALSGSSIQLPNSSTEVLTRYDPGHPESDPTDPYSMVMEDDEGSSRDDRQSFAQTDDGGSVTPSTTGHLSTAYLPQFKQKFGSTPNLSSLSGYSEQEDARAQEPSPLPPGSAGQRSIHEDFEFVPEQVGGSPASSVYAASLFEGNGSDTSGSSRLPPNSTTHHNLLHISPKFGTAIRKLRRPHGSGASKEELSIPPGDITTYLQLNLQPQQQREDRTSSEFDATSHRGTSMEDEQFPRNVSGSFIPGGASFLPEMAAGRSKSVQMTAAPMIVLQKATPYLAQGDASSPVYTEGAFLSDNHRASTQYIPEHRSISQQPQETTTMRLDHRPLSSNGTIVAGSTALKPRRHSINHPPSVASSISGQFQSHLAYGLGMSTVPASPLRKEFSRGEDGTSSPSPPPPSSTQTTIPSETSSAGNRTRTNSETMSMSSTTSSNTSNSVRDHAQSSTLRNILSSLGNKHKKKQNGYETPLPAPVPISAPAPLPPSEAPKAEMLSTASMVSIVGVVAVSHSASVAVESDPYSVVGCVGGTESHRGLHPSDDEMRSWHMPENVKKDIETTTDILATSSPEALKPGEFSLLTGAEPPKAGKKEVLHARPGYIGEYPTPVRMHSFLNREGEAIRDEEEKAEKRKSWQGLYSAGEANGEQGAFEASGERERNKSLPLPDKASMLPGPLPMFFGGELPSGVPVLMNTPSSESSLYTMVFDPSKDSAAVSVDMPGDIPRTGSGGGAVMSRYEYDAMMEHHQMCQGHQSVATDCCESGSVGLVIEQPYQHEFNDQRQQQRQQQQFVGIPPVLELSPEQSFEQTQMVDHSSDVDNDHNMYLQPTSPQTPTTPKKHRNIFKRLIRRKSEDALGHGHHNHPPLSSSSIYLNQGLAQSQSSVTSSSGSAFSIPLFHRHHEGHGQGSPNSVNGYATDLSDMSKASEHMRARTQSTTSPVDQEQHGFSQLSVPRGRPRSSTVSAISTTHS